MDRKTRRANFKNLQPRSTRSTKAAADTLSLSNFFATPESAEEVPSCLADIPIQPDPPAPKIKPIRSSNVFEKPGPKPKKAPKLKASTGPSSSGARRGRGKSKQQPSISNFLRNEQIFAEVTAQHCMADNFSPDDIEMALALSKSESEKHGRLRLHDDDDAVVDLMDDEDKSTERIRHKLQKYGFRTAAKEDYKSLAVLPVVASKGGRRGKWANRFTALTLRNPEVQQKKLEEKVSALLGQKVRGKEPKKEDCYLLPYTVITATLKELRAEGESRILREPSEGPIDELGSYYVTDLFEVSRTPAHHLLKNWAAIQGRDFSPERETQKCRQLRQQHELVYAELERHFGDPQKLQEEVMQELDDLEKLVAENMIEDDSVVINIVEAETSSTGTSPSKEPPDKRPKMTMEDKENLQPTTSKASLTVPAQSTRCTSPDLFADSEDEPDIVTTAISNEPEDVRNLSMKVYKNVSISERSSSVAEIEVVSSNDEPSQITTYEVFSSDEVKTVSNATQEKISFDDKPIDDFIDLTQEFEMVEFNESNPRTPNLIASSEADSNVDNLKGDTILDFTSQDVSCPISKELYAKYANVETFPVWNATAQEEDKIEFSLSMERDLKSSEQSSHQLGILTTPNETERSSSFSELNFSRNSLRRSVSLSTDLSFKSPLNSSAEKMVSPAASPYKQSDASVDLTQNSDDENDAILLSDEEINYSIWKGNKTVKDLDIGDDSSDSCFASPVSKKRAIPQFQTEEDLDAFLMAFSTDGNESQDSHSPNKSALSKERAEFGILDAAPSQPFSLSELQSPVGKEKSSDNEINWAEASFLDAPAKPLARRSSHKFNELLSKISKPAQNSDDDFDEFDLMVFQSKKEAASSAGETSDMPRGLDLLLKGEIKTTAISEARALGNQTPIEPQQVDVDGNVYSVRVCHSPKPDFATLSESEILQQLYKYGIKPLKRKQAVKMLEFIYNQTHPIMKTAAVQDLPARSEPIVRSKSTPVIMERPHSQVSKLTTKTLTATGPKKDFTFNDATGEELLRFSQSLPPSLCDDFETFVMQTNVTKKTPQPLVPLHIAWHNLICANPQLHESVLTYEPIDLQAVYLQLKHMGHRYDPKDLKTFFDRRCIIFRYELGAPGKQAERHVRRHTKKPSKRK
ncbi:structure-specific endonuclease subunit SLX4 isoform X1 [Drosophila sechellia]|uniref:Structure-specific endonuclease subunit SLX4 n=1 Tax=Drosophila sechellia TaxID=7238 RepID=B4HV45_DROSE|nr:structure-specific endonuclease subunit SLX4 isoform X1 [Drosophila sechellia]EDW50816.1 GM14832 [Drosophila sechellia]